MRLSIALLKGAGPRAAACRRSLRTLEGFACGLPCTSSGGLSRRGHTRNTRSIPHVASPRALGGGTSSHGHMGNGECAGQRPVSLHTLSFYMRPSPRNRGWYVLARPHVETPSRGRLGPHISSAGLRAPSTCGLPTRSRAGRSHARPHVEGPCAPHWFFHVRPSGAQVSTQPHVKDRFARGLAQDHAQTKGPLRGPSRACAGAYVEPPPPTGAGGGTTKYCHAVHHNRHS